MKSDILIFQQIVPAYRVPVFRAMYKRFNTLLCHSLNNNYSKVESAFQTIDFPHTLVKNYNLPWTWQVVIPTLIKYKPKIVIAGAAATNFTFLKLLLLKFLFQYRLIAWGHGVNNKQLSTPFKGIRGKIIKYFFRKADAIVFYSESRKNIVQQLFPTLKSKMFVAANTLDLKETRILYDELQLRGKETIKKELGETFKAKYNLIFIGRLLPNKRMDLLLEVLTLLVKECDVALHIIGSGEDELMIKQHFLFGKNIFHYGAIYDEAITGKYLFASDLFVMPGYVGLSIIHAFALGLPLLTCKQEAYGPFHSPEIEYLHHGYNGFLSSNETEIIAKNIRALLENPSQLLKMKKNAERTAYEQCTIDRMLDGFEQAINFVSKK